LEESARATRHPENVEVSVEHGGGADLHVEISECNARDPEPGRMPGKRLGS
jgi:hypothetical protein